MSSHLLVEILISLGIVGIQIHFFRQARKSIFRFLAIFPERQLTAEDVDTLKQGDVNVKVVNRNSLVFSTEFIAILDMINSYLIKNFGAVDYKIIENIINRKISSKDSAVTFEVTLPLYLGLMGTFIGIISGLIAIASTGIGDDTIQEFIGGVVIAMFASCAGLVMTVYNNYQLRLVKNKADDKKNAFYNFLQIELLPHLSNNLFDSLDRLKSNINQFNVKFNANINLFDKTFSENIGSLKETVGSLAHNINPIIENTKSQREFLDTLREIGYTRMAEANLRVFNVMREAGPNFIAFIDKQKELNSTMDQAVRAVNSIESIMDRVKNFEQAINGLGDKVGNIDTLNNGFLTRIDKKFDYLERQFELLEQHGKINQSTISNFFEKEIKRVDELSEKLVISFQNSFGFVIQGNPLEKLLLLEKVSQQLGEIKSELLKRREREDFVKDAPDRHLSKKSNGYTPTESSTPGKKADIPFGIWLKIKTLFKSARGE